ncbi:hypothetical protein NEUTE1DRAFT_54969 [Neurospora tetrasperma FGSC 2508]|uniref:Uncharacterized protein n=1 Tax=Neurospora tetrasperma (strain FGSC 2508 / ATCC MYA-4615 / P0657) TaxID=510951 RepID=F8N1S5_NEUT8|nr:uncharacterized protein NEUTE1DRAFT_54969 [Neurospora tetrasperma FGSC 2508]EGO53201.1 hypothetical protein NEUTE1DRAFT_54969 [Neurospora tetrasperma FGSC 2508]
MSWCHRVPVSYPPPRDHKDYLVSKTLELTLTRTLVLVPQLRFLSLLQRDRTKYLLEKKAIAEDLGDMCEAESGGSDACIFKKT